MLSKTELLLKSEDSSVPKIGIISQARMTSSRLPGKVLKTVQGKTLLQYHLDRLQHSALPVIVATTTNLSDQPIVDLCHPGIPVFRGSEEHVLSRFSGAAKEHQLDIIVRVTSDCPLIDGKMIREAAELYQNLNKPWLYLSNAIQRTYPRGFDFEIFSREMLDEAKDKSSLLAEKEHVTPYIHQNRHGKTNFYHFLRNPDMSAHRLTVDEPADYQLIEKLILDYGCDQKSVSEICEILQKNPDLKKINQHIEQKKF